MITGFNTDVKHEGHVYHVQSEDRGAENPVLESLVYDGGTVVAKKRTPYSDKLGDGAGEEDIAALLKRQHQVIIAAIKAGRIEELITHSRKQQVGDDAHKVVTGDSTPNFKPAPMIEETTVPPSAVLTGEHAQSRPPQKPKTRNSQSLRSGSIPSPKRDETGGLNLDSVIADYLKRSSGEAKLDVRVLTPEVFMAGKSVALRVQVSRNTKPEFDAIVTVKIIGTAFKPQVFIGRVGGDGVAAFSLALPAFTTGTAAIVIEAQSGSGRGELKNLIRRA